MPDLDAARHFLAAHARILDRRRFDRLFADGPADPVRDAVAAHRNPDGGFGHALEPDGRAPGSQWATVELALRTLHEADAWDDDLVRGACDWLARNAPAEGGAGFVDPSIEGWPHAPWWAPQPGNPASLITTGQIAGTLHARGVAHPWLDAATGLMWQRLDALTEAGPYEARGMVRFLDRVPDEQRARAAVERLRPALRGVVTLDPHAGAESHRPLDLAPHPGSVARGLFDDDEIAADLDRLQRGQREDGGWTFDWPAWSPAAEADWRGSVTVDALAVLRANGRLGQAA
jgi:hypothetical protein